MPTSLQRLKMAFEAALSAPLPKVIVPRHKGDTLMPVLPKKRYSILNLLFYLQI
jgi:hypothetical protein